MLSKVLKKPTGFFKKGIEARNVSYASFNAAFY
jgi:hypothetical protein